MSGRSVRISRRGGDLEHLGLFENNLIVPGFPQRRTRRGRFKRKPKLPSMTVSLSSPRPGSAPTATAAGSTRRSR